MTFEELAAQKGVSLTSTPTAPPQGQGVTLEQLAEQRGVQLQRAEPTPSGASAGAKQEEERPGFLKRFFQGAQQAEKDFAIGARKGVAATVRDVSEIGEKGLNAIVRTVLPRGIEGKFTTDARFGDDTKTSAEDLQADIERRFDLPEGHLTKAINGWQKAGFAAERIAEIIAPAALSSKVTAAARAAGASDDIFRGIASLIAKNPDDVARIAGKLAGGTATVATEGALGASEAFLREGDLNKTVANQALFSALLPVGLSAVGKGLGALKTGAFNVLGKTTGVGRATLEQVFQSPGVARIARSLGSSTDNYLRETVSLADDAVKNMANIRRTQYLTTLKSLDLPSQQVGMILDAAQAQVDDVVKAADSVVAGRSVLDKAIDDVTTWDDITAEGLDTLKQRLQGYSQQLSTISGSKAKAKHLVDELAVTVRKGLEDNVPGYTTLTKPYQEMLTLQREIQSALSLKDNNQVETAARKLMQTLRRDDDTRRLFLQQLGNFSEENLLDRVAATQITPLMSRSLSGRIAALITGGGGGAALTGSLDKLLNPAALASAAGVFSMTSPRLVGEFVGLLGQVSAQMAKTNTLSPGLRAAFRQLILEAQREHESTTQKTPQQQ